MKKLGFILSTLFVTTIITSCSKSDAIDPIKVEPQVFSSNSVSVQAIIEYGNLAGSVNQYIKGTIVEVMNEEYKFSTSVEEDGTFRIDNLNSGVYDIHVTYWDSNDNPNSVVLERISVKPNSTTNIGVVVLP